jgi:hypothetical protein
MDLNIGTKDPVNKILWDEIDAKRSQGGFTLASNTPASGVTGWIFKGLPLNVNYTTRVAEVVKTATVITGSTTTATRIAKGSLFTVGDAIANAVEGVAVEITAIDTTTSDDYDILTHTTNGGAFVADTVLFEAAAVAEDGNAAYLFAANALLSDNTKITGSATVTAILSAQEIIEANLPAPVSSEIKTALNANGQYFQFV